MAEQGLLSGQVLGGKYRLDELLGEGGFGAVYRARHLLLDRPQAIKVLLERHIKKPKFRERFLREARTLALLDHPNIVHSDDFVIDEEAGQAYLVMPFLSGGTFRDLLRKRRQPLALDQIRHYLEQICKALDYAHEHDVVHLDLKPQNLLVHADGRLLLSDFGLAHLVKQEMLEGGSSLRFGTAHYMAPEHIHGQPEKGSDIYAMGIVLYEMLTGQRPFEGTIPEAIMMQQLTAKPPSLRALRPDLPAELEEVVQRALAKEASQRYASAGELLRAYQGALGRQQQCEHDEEEERQRRAREEVERLRKVQLEEIHRQELERVRKEAEEQTDRRWVAEQEETHRGSVRERTSLWPERFRSPFGVAVLILLSLLLLGGGSFGVYGTLTGHWPWSRGISAGTRNTPVSTGSASVGTRNTPVSTGSASVGTTESLIAVAWSNAQFVAVGVAGTILTSRDGRTWTAPPSGTTESLIAVAWGGSQFVAVGRAGTILTSHDGQSWTKQASGTADYFFAVAWGNSQFVAVGVAGTILTSRDGQSWTKHTS